ncbi:MAG: hypothetical protein ACFFAU_01150 [Candidatus Hodarchaeota archaeon]
MKSNTDKQIQTYRERYNAYQLKIIDEAIEAFGKTRQGGKIAPTVLLREYIWWEKYHPQRVVAGLKVYLNKQCYVDKKNERYARGIIRLMTDEAVKNTQMYSNDELVEMILDLKKKIIGSCEICNHTGYLFDKIDSGIAKACKCLIEFKKKRAELLRENRGQ